jgi:hypothetical protein
MDHAPARQPVEQRRDLPQRRLGRSRGLRREHSLDTRLHTRPLRTIALPPLVLLSNPLFRAARVGQTGPPYIRVKIVTRNRKIYLSARVVSIGRWRGQRSRRSFSRAEPRAWIRADARQGGGAARGHVDRARRVIPIGMAENARLLPGYDGSISGSPGISVGPLPPTQLRPWSRRPRKSRKSPIYDFSGGGRTQRTQRPRR